MTSYLRYKQQIRTVQDADDDIESWITVRGNHIPIKKGQSKEEAVKSFVESKGEKEKGGDYVSAGREKAKREAGHEFKKRSGVGIKFTEYDPEFETVRKNALANGNVYGGKYTQKSKAEAYKEYKNDTSSKENMKKANEFVNGKPESSKKDTGSIIKQSKVEMTNGLKHITHTTPDGYKFSVWESSNDPGWKTNNLPADYFETEAEATESATKQFKKDLEYYNSGKANKKGKQLFEEKYGTKGTGDLRSKFSQKYDELYKDSKKDAKYNYLVKDFDSRMKDDPQFKKQVQEFVKERGDVLSSDREVKAYMLAAEESGILKKRDSVSGLKESDGKIEFTRTTPSLKDITVKADSNGVTINGKHYKVEYDPNYHWKARKDGNVIKTNAKNPVEFAKRLADTDDANLGNLFLEGLTKKSATDSWKRLWGKK